MDSLMEALWSHLRELSCRAFRGEFVNQNEDQDRPSNCAR